jgi:hypothetical protein
MFDESEKKCYYGTLKNFLLSSSPPLTGACSAEVQGEG